MIDRYAIASQVRLWVEEIDGFGYHRSDQSFLEDIRSGRAGDITARATATRSRRIPKTRIQQLSAQARECDAIMRHIVEIDRRYYLALLYYVTLRNVTEGAKAMKRNTVDFVRYAEGGFAVFGSCIRRRSPVFSQHRVPSAASS